MSGVLPALLMVAFFALAVGLVCLLDRVIAGDADPEEPADEPPDASPVAGQREEPR